MKKKLTLRLDKELIDRAKELADDKGTSVSQMVADYFSLIEKQESPEDEKLPPLTASLSGVLEGVQISEEEFKKYLEEKHLE